MPADGCPAQDPFMGASLLNHLSRPNVRKFGLQIQGEAVVQGEHTMYLIVEAVDERRLREFMQPFQMAGSLDIYPASTCVRAVASGGCGRPCRRARACRRWIPKRPASTRSTPAWSMHRAHPLNCETSIPALVGGVVMPNARFYMRNNFRMPDLDAAAFRLAIGGLVERPQSFTVRDLQNMRSKTQVVTLECAGNGRALFDRPTEGEKWGLGAVSTAEWTGVPLVEILDRAGVRQDAKDVLFRGADGGAVEGRPESDALRAQSSDRRRARQRCAPGLRHERRAFARRARISVASDRSTLVRGRVGQVVDRDRAHRPGVHRTLPGRQVPV